MNTDMYKKQLETELKTVEEELRSIATQNPKNPQDWEATETKMDVMNATADANEAADKQEEYIGNRAITDELEIRFNNITRALSKIEEGTYGTCEVSGEPIEEDRLGVNPAARTCKAHMDQEKNLL
jgi:RNA polymerase-binding transcription factor DksA